MTERGTPPVEGSDALAIAAEAQAIETLLAFAARYDLAELEVEDSGLSITLSSGMTAPAGALTAVPGPAGTTPPRPTSTPEPHPIRSASAHPLDAPLTGIFYRASTPEGPAFVDVGQLIEEGEAVGLIEAMKVFSQVPADRSGRVVEILVENAELVQHGQPLLYIDPLG